MTLLRQLFTVILFSVCSFCQAKEDSKNDENVKSIFLRLHTGKTIDKYIDVPLTEATNLIAKMNLKIPTVFYIHGYRGYVEKIEVTTVVSAYLKRGDHNVIAVDWRELAGKNYITVARSGKIVGKALANALDEMVRKGLPQKYIHVVGHSMGAQVAGYTGRDSSFKIPRITGLDPAGPLFNFIEKYLTASDAKFVDIIHTDVGIYGMHHPSGSTNFYPNGGKRIQPGCPTTFKISSPEDFCSHHRSWKYYAESLIVENSFIATNCSSYENFVNGKCNENIKVAMGYGTNSNVRGHFYLRTKSSSPFGMQTK